MKTVYPHSFGKFVYYSFGIARVLLDCTVPMPALGSVRTHVDVGKIDTMNRQESAVPMMIPLNVCVRDGLILPRSELVKSVNFFYDSNTTQTNFIIHNKCIKGKFTFLVIRILKKKKKRGGGALRQFSITKVKVYK